MSLKIHTVTESRSANHVALVAGANEIKDLPIQDRVKAYRDLAKDHGSRKRTTFVLTTESGVPVRIPAGNARLLLDLREAEEAVEETIEV